MQDCLGERGSPVFLFAEQALQNPRFNWGHEEKAFAKDMEPHGRCGSTGCRKTWREHVGNADGEHGQHQLHRLSKNAERAREGCGPLAFQSWPAACTATAGADFAAEIRRIPAKFGDVGCGGGVCFPVRRLVEKSFLTSYGATWTMRLHWEGREIDLVQDRIVCRANS